MSNVYTEVANALHWALAIPRGAVTAEVAGSVVILHGVVEMAYQRAHAEAIARWVPGVTAVRNEISVHPAQDYLLASLRS